MTKQTARLDDGEQQPQISPSQEQTPNDQENTQAQENLAPVQPQEDKVQSLIDTMFKVFATKAEAKPVEVQEQPVPVPVPAQEEAPKQRLDKTIKGGKYIVNGRLVNANGEPIDENGKVLKPA